MRRAFFDATGQLRSGWWALIFIAIVVPLMGGQFWLQGVIRRLGVPHGSWQLGLVCLATLAATWACTRLRREPLASVGFQLDRRWLGEAGLGAAIGAGQMTAAVCMMWAFGGVTLALDPAGSAWAVVSGALFFLFVALQEEVLFRGFLFQRLRDGLGAWPALLGLAALFALGHWDNPGMEGATKVWAMLDIAVVGLVLGLAYLRTRSLALPIGMHFGWNWMQGSVLGFAVSGQQLPGLVHPTVLGRPQWLTGGAFGVEASVSAVVVDTLTLVVLLLWKPRDGGAPISDSRVELAA
jgi:membrane protease YdiL (CAAX protease family)